MNSYIALLDATIEEEDCSDCRIFFLFNSQSNVERMEVKGKGGRCVFESGYCFLISRYCKSVIPSLLSKSKKAARNLIPDLRASVERIVAAESTAARTSEADSLFGRKWV